MKGNVGMWVSSEQLLEQIRADRTEFSGLATDVRDALKMQVRILRRMESSGPHSQDSQIQVNAA